MFNLTCPRCGAKEEDARLAVISGTFRATKMYLCEDGFATADAKQFDTDNEKVYCHVCDTVMDLRECMDER